MNTDRIHRGDTAVHLTDLIPDLDDFVRTAFDVRPVVLPGAMAHRLDHLPTAAVLDRLLQLDVLPSELVRMSRSGQGLPVNSYTRHVGQTHLSTVVDRAKVMQLFRSGATLTVNDLQQVWPTALDLVRVVGDAFACGAEATAFATPAGRAGFAPHSDELGVLVVQAEGTKDWRVWPTDLAGPRTRATFEDGTLGEPMFAVTLEPGDVLYLPQGTPHAAAATHEQSIHLSLGLRPRSWNDIVTAVVSTHLDPQGRTQFPALTAGHTEGLAGDLCMQLRELGALADTIDPVAALRAVREDVPGATLRFDGDGLADLRRLDACPTDQLFRVDGDALEVMQDGGERCTVRVDGVTVTLPSVIVSTLTAGGSEARVLTCRQIYPHAPVGTAMSIARQLTRLGALALAGREA